MKLIYMEGLTMGRVYNFSAGPAVLPVKCLRKLPMKCSIIRAQV